MGRGKHHEANKTAEMHLEQKDVSRLREGRTGRRGNVLKLLNIRISV